MNLFFKSYRYYLIFSLLITCGTGINKSFSQNQLIHSNPWIQEIYLPHSLSQLPNETFCRNEAEELFIGKPTGLMISSDKGVQFIPMEAPVYVAASSIDTLFYAVVNDIGLLVRTESGEFKAISKAFRLPVSKRHFKAGPFVKTGGGYAFNSKGGAYYIDSKGCDFLKGDSVSQEQLPDKELVKSIIHRQEGLAEASIRQVQKEGRFEYWVLSEFALHQLLWPSPLQIMDTDEEVLGSLNFSVRFNGKLYLGSSKGLFCMEPLGDEKKNPDWEMKLLTLPDKGSIHHYSRKNGSLYVAGDKGLYQVLNGEVTLIDNRLITGLGAIDQNQLLASGPGGSKLYRKPAGEPGKWKVIDLREVPGNAYSFAQLADEIFFVAWEKVFRYLPENGECMPVAHPGRSRVLTLVAHGDLLILQEEGQASIYNIEEARFKAVEKSQLAATLAATKEVEVDAEGLCWVLGGQGNRHFGLWTCNDLEEKEPLEEPFPLLRELGPFIHLELENDNLYLTARDRIVLLNLDLLREKSYGYSARIESYGNRDKMLGFRLGGLELQKDPAPLFRERLQPRQKAWSSWHSNRDILISEPGPGNYVLEVEMMDLYGRIGPTARFELRIPLPWYRQWYAWITYALALASVLFLLRKWWMLSYQRAESRVSARMEMRIDKLTREKARSDRLVAEILPEKTAIEIKSLGKVKPQKYEKATVLFSDIQGFTKIAEEMNPEVLIDELDKFFFHFDSVVEKYNIEKIKTIGDAYMAAGGIPRKNSTNPVEVVLAALEMQAYMQDLKANKANIWDLRIGIHSGPVIAGVVGHKKISYDIWGDTVNTASRMESSGEPGRVNISGISYGMVKDYFICEYRGKLPVKYKGDIDMYFVNGLRPELSVDLKGLPNRRFYTKLQILRMNDLEEKVFALLSELPDNLPFHTQEYARKVYNQAFLLCRAEEIEQEDRLLVRTAALCLFTGLTQSYYNFENRSAVIAREILPGFAYSEKQTDHVCNLILATKAPFDPVNKREKIIVDLRMEYLGRPDYPNMIKDLFQELKENGAKLTGQQFKNQQVELLYNFDYFTIAARRLREVSGKEQLARLEEQRII